MKAVLKTKQFLRKVSRELRKPRVVERQKIVVQSEHRGCPNPVMLIGMPRSGTTLMRQVIDSHSNIACPPETFFLREFARVFEDRQSMAGLRTMGYERGDAIKLVRQGVEPIYGLYAESKGKKRWADKTPPYVFILPFIEEMFGPGCQYLMLYRHPLDILYSMWRMPGMREGRLFERYDGDPLRNAAMYLADGTRKMMAFEAEHPDRCFHVRYDRFTTEPEATLRELLDFLGEPWEESVLRFNEQEHDRGQGDPSATSFDTFKPSIGNWKAWDDEMVDKAVEVLKPVMDELGYTTESPATPTA